MGAITDKGMQAKVTAKDQWLSQPFKRGAGVFMGRITPAGERIFYLRYTDSKGQRPFLAIGPYHSKGQNGLTLSQGYARACEWSALLQSGIKNLREHFEQSRLDAVAATELEREQADLAQQQTDLETLRQLSLRKLFARWAATELKPHVRADGSRTGRKDGGEYARQQFERHVFPTLGDTTVTDIRKSDVLAILDKIKADGKLRTANVLLTELKQMFRFALAREIVERNPLDVVTKRDAGGIDATRDRVLGLNEITTLAAALPSSRLSPRGVCAIWLVLATGCRIGELMGATWGTRSQPYDMLAAAADAGGVKLGFMSIENKNWHLPDTKNGRSHTIHLSAFALAQVERLAELGEVDDQGLPIAWVFPNSTATGPVCVKSFGKQLADRQRQPDQRMSGRSKHTDSLSLAGGKWTAHDLRRTAATMMAELGISGDVIDECLNHVIESRVRRVYIRDRREVDQARAFDALGARLQAVATGQALVSNIIDLRSTSGADRPNIASAN